MREEYDLSKMKSRPNPYAKQLNRQVTIDTEISVIEYFKEMAKKSGISYQNLINLYLKDCVNSNRELKMQWSWVTKTDNKAPTFRVTVAYVTVYYFRNGVLLL